MLAEFDEFRNHFFEMSNMLAALAQLGACDTKAIPISGRQR